MVGIYIKALMKGASKVSPTIKSVKPNVPTTKKEKALSKLAIAKQKTKGSAAKLKQTLFKIKEKAKAREIEKRNEASNKLFRENKMGGGMMGRRFGYSEGKLAVTPREKQLAAQYGDKKRITRGDVITAAKNKSGKRMQAKFGGGADTGKLGELRSKLGVVQNKIKRKTERLKKLKSARDSLKGKRGADI